MWTASKVCLSLLFNYLQRTKIESLGNEADYILISVVRSTGPGFLISRNRVNTMLTRCRRGMIVVTKRAFTKMWNVQETLLGNLVDHWRDSYGREMECWKDWKTVAEGKADMPGCPPRSLIIKTEVPNPVRSLFCGSSPPTPQLDSTSSTDSKSSVTSSRHASLFSSPLSARPSQSTSTSLSVHENIPSLQKQTEAITLEKGKIKEKKRALPYAELYPSLPSSSPTSDSASNAATYFDSKNKLDYATLIAKVPAKPWGALQLNQQYGNRNGRPAPRQPAKAASFPKQNAQLKLKQSKPQSKPQPQPRLETNPHGAKDGYNNDFPDMLPEPRPERAWNATAGQWRGCPPPEPAAPMQAQAGHCGIPKNSFVDAIWGPVELLRPKPVPGEAKPQNQRQRK